MGTPIVRNGKKTEQGDSFICLGFLTAQRKPW